MSQWILALLYFFFIVFPCQVTCFGLDVNRTGGCGERMNMLKMRHRRDEMRVDPALRPRRVICR